MKKLIAAIVILTTIVGFSFAESDQAKANRKVFEDARANIVKTIDNQKAKEAENAIQKLLEAKQKEQQKCFEELKALGKNWIKDIDGVLKKDLDNATNKDIETFNKNSELWNQKIAEYNKLNLEIMEFTKQLCEIGIATLKGEL